MINITRGTVLGSEIELADTPRSRARGLLGTYSLAPGEGMWLTPCRHVHTMGMRYPIDLAFLDCRFRVLRTAENLPPSRISPLVWRARSVLELPAGRLKETNTQLGDVLEIYFSHGEESQPASWPGFPHMCHDEREMRRGRKWLYFVESRCL